MYQTRQETLKEILEVALTLSPVEQHSYLVKACDRDEEMLHEIQLLLSKNQEQMKTTVMVSPYETKKQKIRLYLFPSLAVVLFLALMVPLIWYFAPSFKENSIGSVMKITPSDSANLNSGEIITTKVKSFSYGFDLIRVKNTPSGNETIIKTSDKLNFHNLDKIRIRFVSKHDGYLYLLNEGDVFSVIGFYSVKANEEIHTKQLQFFGKPGVENFWFVLSEKKIDQLEIYKDDAKIDSGTINIRDFIAQYIPTDWSEVEDERKENIIVSATGNIIAYKTELWHK